MTADRLARPKGWTNRDILCGVLASAANELKLPASLDVAAKACEPLWEGKLHDPKWYPKISIAHAVAAVRCASAAMEAGAISKSEYDFVCAKCRCVLVREQPLESPDVRHENPRPTP